MFSDIRFRLFITFSSHNYSLKISCYSRLSNRDNNNNQLHGDDQTIINDLFKPITILEGEWHPIPNLLGLISMVTSPVAEAKASSYLLLSSNKKLLRTLRILNRLKKKILPDMSVRTLYIFMQHLVRLGMNIV